MKKLVIIIALFAMIGCSDSNESSSESLIVSNFLSDVRSLDRVNSTNAIVDFVKEAPKLASKTMELTKDNMDEFLTLGKEYDFGVITCGNHTIVRIKDFEDCKTSTSWGACMPYGEGYIKKGDFIYQTDFTNNIIGTPDSQKRVGYLFKE